MTDATAWSDHPIASMACIGRVIPALPSGCTHKFAPRLEAITPDRARRGTNRKSLEVVQSEWLRVPQKGLVKKDTARNAAQPRTASAPHIRQ